MKRVFFTLVVAGFVAGVGNGYAATVDTKSKKFDSSVNFVGKDMNQYLGQELYLNTKPADERDFGLVGFYSVPKPVPENVYKPNAGYYTTYDALAGKYFNVVEIVRHPEAPYGEIFENGVCLMKLEERESKETVYYEYNSNSQYSFPFFVTGFVEKQKTLAKGKQYVFNDNALYNILVKTELETGKPVTLKTGQTWTCIDVKVLEGSHTLSLIVQNALGEKTIAPQGTKAYTLAEAESYRKKFGTGMFDKLLTGNVSPGMNKEMVRIALGEPYVVNGQIKSGKKQEEWLFYSGHRLYFSNEILFDIKKQ